MPAPPSFDAPIPTSPYNNAYSQQVAHRQALLQRSQANTLNHPAANGSVSGGGSSSGASPADCKSLVGGRFKIYPREL
ncbi:hypothetical protein DRE_07514 [Drechslerella stenobrocha 248]|uniref:Uncharacterized protein n=1 Tax=Drechslerella stenobrocha 248 TaxID=1043628 RepID=W7HTU9_9PEZI|nr:hypothetical protein DRE_07514 [Drechslerella stenobrocha 248]